MRTEFGRLECIRPRKTRIPWVVLGLAILISALAPWTRADDDVPAGVKVFSFGFDESRAFPGYTLMSPLNSSRTYLFDLQGRVVRMWQSDCSPGLCPYLLENGCILRAGAIGRESQVFGAAPGVGGRVQMFDWNGDVVWDFRCYNARQIQHHDAMPLPNGNVLLIVWDRKTAQEALSAGRRPELCGDGHLLVDALIEVKPRGKTSGEVVWQWHLWDHLVQDFDRGKPNYGNVAAQPERVDLNFGDEANADWTHANGVAYNAALDQIMLSVHHFNEFWIIDHSTTAAQAAGRTGGRGGKGGDLLYRWGNPRAYRAGTKKDQQLFGQHNAHWIEKGLPGAGHVLVFNNGLGRLDGSYSSVDELILPVDAEGRYSRRPGDAFAPDGPTWSYAAPKKTDFYSYFISGAQRLRNGNTLICSGAEGVLFEVTAQKEVVWKFINPIKGDRGPLGGFGPGPRPGDVLSPITRVLLAISPRQARQLDGLQREVDRRLAELLTADQGKQLTAAVSPDVGSSYQAGQVLSDAEQRRVQLSDEQKSRLAQVQSEVDGVLKRILTEAQRQQFKSEIVLPGSPPGWSAAAPTADRAREDDIKSASEASEAMPVFRVYRYAADHPALAGKDLTGTETIEEYEDH